uniref:Ectonucleotide pyrophosphatase/phosphodiesterase 1 n=1 Tax=Salarias fasciatus TaxID=181472 RepID=A0A672HH94_SALFA
MEEASCEKATFVSNYVDDVSNFTVIQGPAARIRPKDLPNDYFSCEIPDQPMRPYLKENLPKRLHFANNKRIERGHLYMKAGCCFKATRGPKFILSVFQAIFIGYGPAFKVKTVVPPFENIELYNVMCGKSPGYPPAPNNGSHGSLNHLLKRPAHQPVHPAQLSHDTPISCQLIQVSIFPFRCAVFFWDVFKFEDDGFLSLGVKASLRRLHHPFGTPSVVQPDASFCLLHQPDYLSGYSRDRLMPSGCRTPSQLGEARPPIPEAEACVRADVRVPAASSQLCARYEDDPALSYGLLHPPSECVSAACVWPTMAPMFPAFKDVWTYFHDVLLPKYSQELNGVNVMSGPVFDEDYDGNVDALQKISGASYFEGERGSHPEHFFLILTGCRNSTFSPVACEGPLQTRAFILPHRPDHSESCDGSDLSWVEDWLQLHSARVRDIELLTGLSFYHDRLSVEETLRLKTFLQTA